MRLATGAISAGSGPTLLGTLEDPDFTDLLLTQSGVRVSVSHPAGTRSDANQRLGDRPSWATRERRVQVPVPAWLAELAHLQRPAESARAPARGVPTDATAADPDASVAGAARQVHANLYANAGDLGVELFLGFAAARSEDEATGVLVTLPAALIERMRQRVAAIAGRVRAAARALRPTRGAEPPAERAPSSSAVRIAALVSGVRLTAAVDGRDSYIEYGWPTVLELLQGHHDLATLMPDRFDLHTRALELQYLPEPEIQAARDAAGAAAEATAREARARQITDASTRGMLVRDLPALLRDALAALDLQPLDRVRLPDESEAGSTRVDAQTGMCSITLRVWRASQPTRLWTLSFGMSLEGLVQLVLPRRLSQRMGQRDARNLIGFRPNPQDHRLEVFYRRLGPDRRLHFEVRAGWTLAEIFDVLSHLAEVAEHPARAMPSSFTGAYEAADIRLSLHYDERAPASPPGDGDHAVDFRAMPTLAEAMRSVLSADVVARAQLYYTLPSEAALEAQVMAALQHPTERSFTMTSVKLVVPPAPADAGAASARAAQSPTTAPRTRVYSVSVDLDPSALLQLVRLLPYAGTLMRVGEFLERMLMDKEFRDGLTYTPEVIYDLIADAPELAHMIGDGQWNLRTGLALLTAESPDLASIAAFYRVMREQRRLFGHVPQRSGSEVAERIAAAADLGVFYRTLSELQPGELEALLRYGHDLQQANPHLAFSRDAFARLRDMPPERRRALVTRMAEQAAQLRAIGATPTAPSPDAQGEQLELTAGGATSAPGGARCRRRTPPPTRCSRASRAAACCRRHGPTSAPGRC
ncbi:MAG: hypothetical protein U1F43_35815 [Myxococcota bacterium]